MREPDIRTRRAYEPAAADDGVRVLIDRLWPRGRSRTELKLDAWRKEIAPSDELRKWFHHDTANWEEFQKRYRAELRERTAEMDALLAQAEKKTLTLVYGARDEKHNHAEVLRRRLLERHRKRAASR